LEIDLRFAPGLPPGWIGVVVRDGSSTGQQAVSQALTARRFFSGPPPSVWLGLLGSCTVSGARGEARDAASYSEHPAMLERKEREREREK